MTQVRPEVSRILNHIEVIFHTLLHRYGFLGELGFHVFHVNIHLPLPYNTRELFWQGFRGDLSGFLCYCWQQLFRVLIFTKLFLSAYGNLGSVLSTQGRVAEAEQAFRRALLHRPNMADVHYNLWVILPPLILS